MREQLCLALGRPARNDRLAVGDQTQLDLVVVQLDAGAKDELIA